MSIAFENVCATLSYCHFGEDDLSSLEIDVTALAPCRERLEGQGLIQIDSLRRNLAHLWIEGVDASWLDGEFDDSSLPFFDTCGGSDLYWLCTDQDRKKL